MRSFVSRGRAWSVAIVTALVACSSTAEGPRTTPPDCPASPSTSASAGGDPSGGPRSSEKPRVELAGDEGMWLTNDFPSERVKERHGFLPDRAWLDHVRLSSVRLARGCSGSFVSPNGLVMTNHHCAHECIQQLSTKKKDYIASGFYAKADKDEVKCPGAEIDQLVEITDVTDQMNAATKGLTDKAYFDAQRAEKSKIEAACGKTDDVRCDVVTLYHGGRYHLYKYRRYQDVRLVFAPELAIAFFGGDPDNFNFPRYDLDVSFVRVYENDKPAKTEHYFKWSKEGPKEGAATFVSGHPGGTSRELTMAQLEFQRDVALPDRLIGLSEMRGVLTEFAKTGKEQARVSKDELFFVENAIKALRGEHQSLTQGDFYKQKAAAEAALREMVKADPELSKIAGGAWDAIAEAKKAQKAIRPAFNMLEGAKGFDSGLFEQARALVRYAEETQKPNGERLREFAESQLPAVKNDILSSTPYDDAFEMLKLGHGLTKLREVLGADHPIVKKVLGPKSPTELARELVQGTKLKDAKVRKALLEGGRAALEKSTDPMILLAKLVDGDARAARKVFEEKVQAVEQKNGELIAKASFAIYGTSTYPDATFTLRLSYGKVDGWVEPDGKVVPPFTNIGGAFDRATGRDPFKLPDSWIAAKDKLDKSIPFDMSLTNDVVGGNSGSPVVNQKAEVVGLIFDGNIHSLGGEFGYDPKLNRSVAVTNLALEHALSKIYGADRILAELVR